MKFSIKKLDLIVGLAIGIPLTVTAIVLPVTSYAEYGDYVRQYDAEVAATAAKQPQGPEYVYVDNEFATYDEKGEFITASKSDFTGVYTVPAADFNLNYDKAAANTVITVYDPGVSDGTAVTNIGPKGGSIGYEFSTEAAGGADLDFVFSSELLGADGTTNLGTQGLGNYLSFTLNNIAVDTSQVVLPVRSLAIKDRFNWQHVILRNVNLKEGNNSISIATGALNPFRFATGEYVFPNFKNLTIFTDTPLSEGYSANGDNAQLWRVSATEHYYVLTGTYTGYGQDQLSFDFLTEDGQVYDLPEGSLSLAVANGRYVAKVRAEKLTPGVSLLPRITVGTEEASAILTNNLAKLTPDGISATLQTSDDYAIVNVNQMPAFVGAEK